MRKSVFESKVKELKTLKQQEEIIKKRIEILESELKQDMLESEVFEHSGVDWKLTWNAVQSNRFNQSSFKEEHPRLYKKYLVVSESRRFILR